MDKHRFDPISFVFGLAFVAVALLFVIPEDPWEIYFGGLSLGWLWPLLVIAAGVALLVPVLRGAVTSPSTDDADDPGTSEDQDLTEALEELGEPPV